MDDEVVVHDHALKHGMRREDVIRAWVNYIVAAVRVPGESEVRVGVDSLGRRVEMVGRLLVDGRWLVYHAMTPPTRKVLREIDRRMRGV